MGFLIRNVFFAVILLGLAYAFFANKDLLMALGDSIEQDEPAKVVSVKKEAPKPTSTTTSSSPKTTPDQQIKKTANAAADGLSNFYAKIYGDGISDKGPKVRNNMIYLPDPQGDLVEILQARELTVQPYKKNWQGTTTSRAFRKGQTLYQKLAEYADQDGLQVIWWLNKDFIIKDFFRIEKNILKTAQQIGQAVSGHFPEGISSYFCYRQRTVVFVNEAPKYLVEECSLLKSKYNY